MCKFVCRLLRVGSYFFIDTFKCWTQQKYEKKINRRRNYRKSKNCFGVFSVHFLCFNQTFIYCKYLILNKYHVSACCRYIDGKYR